MKKNDKASLKGWLKRLPNRNQIPFELDRTGLYRIADLYRGYDPHKPETWKQCFDHRIYEWTLIDPAAQRPKARPLKPYEAVAERLHDASIGFAIDRYLKTSLKRDNKPAIGFMGGHDTDRNDPAFARVAHIARSLRQSGFTIVSGGGPGLMEAANFGAFMAGYSDGQFAAALSTLAAHPKTSEQAEWVASACAVRARLLPKWNSREKPASESLGVPTWYYGNEPPNLFTSHTGKYFFNSVREDGLLSIATGGIIFGPGNAGTVQELFQDLPLNYYRDAGIQPTPMILLGTQYWNPPPTQKGELRTPNDLRKPAWALLTRLSEQSGNPFRNALELTDDPDKVVRFISDYHSRSLSEGVTWEDRSRRFKGRATAVL